MIMRDQLDKVSVCAPLAVISICLSGCATSFSTLKLENSTHKTIYSITEEQAFDIALTSVNRVLPGLEITDVEGPPRGYSVTRRSIIDAYSHTVSVIPASAVDAERKEVQGYYFEVSGGGTLFDGPAATRELFSAVLSVAQATGKSIYVSDVSTGVYKWADWKNEKAGAQRRYLIREQTGNDNDAFSQLEKLKRLRDKDAITEEEYQTKKKELLGRIK